MAAETGPVVVAGTSVKADPSPLTTDALHREIESLDHLIESRLDGLKDTLDEKFRRVDQQFELVERQRVEQKVDTRESRVEQKADTKAAVDAALIAQKEAVREQTIASERQSAKSEASTTKQLDQLGTIFTTAMNGLVTSIDDLKERVGKIENQKLGGQQTYMTLIIIAGLVVAVLGYIAANNP